MNEQVSGIKLTSTQAIILAAVVRLNQDKKITTQRLVSEAVKIDPMTASQAIRTLEKKKYITRELSTDKRARILAPTIQGKEIAQQSVKLIAAAHKSFFKSLEQRQLKHLVLSLQVLIEHNATNEDENDE